MLKIISSKVAARKAIKAQLKKEIPFVNEAIENKIKDGEASVTLKVSDASAQRLKKAGYQLEGMGGGVKHIYWGHMMIDLEKNDSEMDKIAKEIGLDIVGVQ